MTCSCLKRGGIYTFLHQAQPGVGGGGDDDDGDDDDKQINPFTVARSNYLDNLMRPIAASRTCCGR